MAQEGPDQAADVAAIRELLDTQFRSLAWTRDEDAGWAAFTRGFFPGTSLFPAARPARPQTVDQFVARMQRLREDGKLASFEETPLGCAVRVFGNVAVAFAACEMLENGSTLTRDVSAVVLVRDGAAWRIVAQAWDVETESRKIPRDLGRRSAGEGA